MMDTRPEGRFATALDRAMREKRITKKNLAAATGISYEHIRKLVKGVAYPSRYAMKEICELLSLDVNKMQQLLVSDRIENKFGGIPHQILGKHPELSLLAPMWDNLTAEQKHIIKMTVKNLAEENVQTRMDSAPALAHAV